LAAGLRPKPLRELTALPIPPSWIQRGGAGWEGGGEGRDGERRDREGRDREGGEGRDG